MTLPTWYDTGTASVANGSPTVTGTGTLWGGDAIMAGDLLCDLAQPLVPPQRIASVEANGELTLAAPWPGTALTDDAYEIRYVGIIERSTAQTRRVLAQLGDVKSWADIFVATDVDRLALETEGNPLPSGRRVLVIDDGLIWAKKTGVYGDWLPPVEFKGDRGDAGPFTEITFGAVTTGAAGTSASANVVVVDADTIRIDLTIPKGTDGAGTGDMVGPAVAVDGQLASADGITGKLIKFLTAAQATAGLNAVVGDAGSGGTKGLVPAPAAGDAAAGKFLKADGTWAAVALAELEMTVSQLALQVADNTNVALFLGPSGNRVADSFDALTYVDVAGATNLDTSVPGLLKPTVSADTYATTNDITTLSDGGSLTVRQVRQRIPASALSTSGDKVRLTLKPQTSGGSTVIEHCYIGTAGTGEDFAGDQVRVTFGGGSNGVTLTAGGASVVSDAVDLSLNEAADLMISMQFSSEAPAGSVDAGASAGYVRYLKAGSGDYATTDVSGYGVTTGRIWLPIDLIQVRTATGSISNLTVRSSNFTAASVPAKMKALIRVKEVDPATAGTDYTLECSRDSGTTWATMTLTELFTSPSPSASIRVVEAAETSVSAQPSGTAPRWRFKTLNNKNVELHDALLYWS